MAGDEEDGLSDLWAGLEQEARGTGDGPLVTVAKGQVTRRATPSERLAESFFSGFLPALLILTCGGMLAALEAPLLAGGSLEGLPALPAVVLVLALPLAGLLAPLLRTDRSTFPRLLALCVLAGGVLEVGLAIPLWGLRYLANEGTEPFVLAQMLQSSYELYLSAASMLAFTLLALLLSLSHARIRRAMPWVEIRSSSSLKRQVMGALVATTPLVLLGVLGLAQGRINPELLSWADTTRSHLKQDRPLLRSNDYRPWGRLLSKLEAEQTEFFAIPYPERWKAMPTWSAEDSRALEQEAFEIFAQSLDTHDSWARATLVELLLRRPEQLREPDRLVLELAHHQIRSGYAWVDIEVLERALTRTLIPRLATAPMTTEQMRAMTAQVDEVDRAIPSDPLRELNNSIYSHYVQANSELTRPTPQLRAFGYALPFSLVGLADEIRMGRELDGWLREQHDLNVSSAKALWRSARKVFPFDEKVLHRYVNWSTESAFSLNIRPYLQTAHLVLALRLYKQEHGSYPLALESLNLKPEYRVENWKYSLGNTGRAALSLTPDHIRDGAKVTTWTLP